jgi:hypothetical protein
LILYTDHIGSSQLADEVGELAGKRLLSDTPDEMPCVADVLIAMVYYAWMEGSLEMQQGYAKPKKWARQSPNRWSKKALGLMAAATGDAWRAIYNLKECMERQPLLSFKQTHRWQRQALMEIVVSYFPEEIFEEFDFPHIGDMVMLPASNGYAEWTDRRGTPPGCPRPPSQGEKIAARITGEQKRCSRRGAAN